MFQLSIVKSTQNCAVTIKGDYFIQVEVQLSVAYKRSRCKAKLGS